MLLGPAITAVGAFFGGSEHADYPSDPPTSVEVDRSAGLDRQSLTCISNMSSTRAISGCGFEGRSDHQGESETSILGLGARDTTAQVGMQFEVDINNQDVEWLERDYYKTNWAPPVSFWSCLQISLLGIFLVTPMSNILEANPLGLLMWLWVWAFFGQPAAIFAIILVNVAGEEFAGGRKWLSHGATCHGLTFGFCLLGTSSLVVSFIGFGVIALPPMYGVSAFVLFCMSSTVGIMVYEALMFFQAR